MYAPTENVTKNTKKYNLMINTTTKRKKRAHIGTTSYNISNFGRTLELISSDVVILVLEDPPPSNNSD